MGNPTPNPKPAFVPRQGYPAAIDPNTAFSGPIEPVRPSAGYVALTALVALFMLLLPLIYFAIVAGLGYGLYAYFTDGLEMFKVKGGPRPTQIYDFAFRCVVMVVGVVLLFFLVKPFFAPRGKYAKPEPVYRSEEPLLYEYVESLCQALRAPVPREIVVDCDLNASAGFRHGILSLFWSDLRLTIGMPMAAGLDLRQFTGILSHELGHFSQRAAIRFSYVITTINGWLARIAYERDMWDLRILVLTYLDDRGVRLLGYLLMGCIWVTRLIPKALCWTGAIASLALSRAMEYNADVFQTRVAGSAAMARMHRRIHDLAQAQGVALNELTNRKEMERIPDNLPVLYAAATDRTPVEQLDKAWKLHADENVGLFGTHPAPNERIAAAEQENVPGVLQIDAPASVLFKDFDGMCRRVTYLFVRAQIGKDVMDLTFAPVEEFLHAHAQTSRALASLESIVGPEVLKTFSIRPMFLRLDSLEQPADPQTLPERWNKAREAMAKLRPTADAAAVALREADDQIDRAVQAESLKRAKVKFDAKKYGLKTGSVQEAEESRLQALNARAGAEHSLESFEKAYRQRVACALQLLTLKGIDARVRRAAELKAEANRVLVGSASLRECFGTMYELSRRVLAAQAIFTGSTRMAPPIAAELDRLTGEMNLALRRAYADLDIASFPFEHHNPDATIAGVLLESLPKETDGPTVLAASASFRDGYVALTRRALARLCEIAIEVENAIRSGKEQPSKTPA